MSLQRHVPERAGGVVTAHWLYLQPGGVTQDRHSDGPAVEQGDAHQRVGPGRVGHERKAPVERHVTILAGGRGDRQRPALQTARRVCAPALLDIAGGTLGR